jgi:hypothetical protein
VWFSLTGNIFVGVEIFAAFTTVWEIADVSQRFCQRVVMDKEFKPQSQSTAEPDDCDWICYDCDSVGPFETVWYPAGDADVMCLACHSLNTGESGGAPCKEEE